MTPYICNVISREEIALFEKIRERIKKLPDLDLGKDSKGKEILLSCHILARAVGEVFNLRVVDGYFYSKMYPHSWVTTRRHLIIDVYPIATYGGPVLFDRANFFGAEDLYREGELSIDFSCEIFQECVRKVKEYLKPRD